MCVWVCVTLLLSGVNVSVRGSMTDTTSCINFSSGLAKNTRYTDKYTHEGEHWRPSWRVAQLMPRFHCRNSNQEPRNIWKHSPSPFNLGVFFFSASGDAPDLEHCLSSRNYRVLKISCCISAAGYAVVTRVSCAKMHQWWRPWLVRPNNCCRAIKN